MKVEFTLCDKEDEELFTMQGNGYAPFVGDLVLFYKDGNDANGDFVYIEVVIAVTSRMYLISRDIMCVYRKDDGSLTDNQIRSINELQKLNIL
jgi:hypothetical protein